MSLQIPSVIVKDVIGQFNSAHFLLMINQGYWVKEIVMVMTNYY